MTQPSEWLRALLALSHAERQCELLKFTAEERSEIRFYWKLWARESQIPPPGDWQTWLLCAGRGFGKTRAGAEWVRRYAQHNYDARIALVGANLAEARAVMVEGESGILAVCPPDNIPVYEPSLRRLSWANGAQAFLYSAAEPESLRGPQHHIAWCDELAKWENASERASRSWDNLLLSLRLSERPRTLVTTTPRAVPLLKRLLAEEACGTASVTHGTTGDNAAHLPERYLGAMRAQYGDTALGRQELGGVLLEDIEGALWTRSMLEHCRAGSSGAPATRVVIGVDPPASTQGDACGIVVCALDTDGRGRVLADCSVAKARPERWARAVADAAHGWNADRVIAEANQGGAMVRSVLLAAELSLPVRLVHASRGKTARAEPVAALYEAGRVFHAGLFPELEDQLCGLMTGGAYEGPGRSPDRADALVWALSELMLGPRGAPRIRNV